jgi:preprotein translocase subunit YajC
VLISLAHAQTAPAAAGGGSDPMQLVIMFGLMFAVMYFLIIRPQQKRQKEQKAMMDALAIGDELVTIGGVLGTVRKLNETYLFLEIASGVQVQVERTAVLRVLPKGTVK